MTTVGMIGLGLLGGALASRLRGAGHDVVGHDVVAERCLALRDLGGAVAASAREVADRADLVCVVLPSLDSVERTVLGPDGIGPARPGRTVILQMSTISPALTERLARGVAERGLGFLDCPVSGTSGMVARGDGAFFVGGDPTLFERCRPVLESMLPRVTHVGPAPHAMVLKLAANLLVGLHSAAAAEALAMAQRAGLDMSRALEVLTGSAGTSRMLEVRGPMMARAEFPPQMKLELFMKDLHLIQDAARAVGASLPLTDVAERLYAGALAAGHQGEDLAVVVTALDALGARPAAAPPR
jgi:3-hydroxyisobutyrate dehydrogenase-like beta-hydroxyacid dehydrogenase